MDARNLCLNGSPVQAQNGVFIVLDNDGWLTDVRAPNVDVNGLLYCVSGRLVSSVPSGQ